MERINVGMLVDIRRSDGRVHSATICEVREGTQSVTVEWFENGETKGKEIDLKALLAINPTLTTTQLSSMNFVSLASEEENTCEFVRASELQLRTQNNTEEMRRLGMPFSRTSDIGTFYTTAARNGGGFRTNLSGYKRVSSLQTPNKPSKQNTHRFPLDQSCLEFDFLTGSSTSGAVQNMAKFGLSQNIHKPSVVREIGRLQRNREERIAQLVNFCF
ncbi:unnamed protein product [Thelazia callipaeda]|uniref:Ig-like domain-containing protein n=1 Tax=Thelazia callipaeda TaxID=103827 RepID=A0A0N5CTE7_THECL|nr:unnamed protein product [Thelazia callipaeda]